jgi:hypothetical protein
MNRTEDSQRRYARVVARVLLPHDYKNQNHCRDCLRYYKRMWMREQRKIEREYECEK